MGNRDQHKDKMQKKPKKDTAAPKQPGTSDRPTPPMTVVLPKGKEKYK